MNKLKKVLALIIAVTIMASMGQASFTAVAAEAGSVVAADGALTGSCGENVTYSIDEAAKTLTISGTGAMYDFKYEHQPWLENNALIEKVVVEDGVTRVGNYAFSKCTSLTSAEIANSVTEFGASVFYKCESLQNVILPDNIEEITMDMFRDCTALTDINIPSSVTSIDYCAFYNCFSLKNITLPQNLQFIGNYAFNGNGFTELDIPSSVVEICDGAFSRCAYLIEVTIPSSVEEIPDDLFNECTRLQTVNLPETIKSIGYAAFGNCSALTEIYIPDSVTKIERCAFEKCINLTKVRLSENLITIMNDTFNGCSSLTEIKIPDSVALISYGVFNGCTKLEKIEIPDNVSSINSRPFEDSTVICGSNGSYAETYAKENGYVFESNGKECSYAGKCGYDVYYNYNKETQTLVISGTGPMYDYEISSWGTVSDSPIFKYAQDIKEIIIGDGVTSFGSGSIGYAKNTEEIYLPASIEDIDLKGYLPVNNGKLMIYAEEGTYAYNYAMEYHYSINGIIQGICGYESYDESGNKLQTPYYMFYSDTGVLTVKGEGALKYYNSYYDFTPWRKGEWGHLIKEIVLEEGIKDTGGGFLDSCTNLKSFTIPSTVTYIDDTWYTNGYYENFLESINVSENNEKYSSVDGVLFNKDKTELIAYPKFKTDKDYIIPDTVETIGYASFAGNKFIENVDIPDGVKTIDNFAFKECSSLNNVILPDGLTQIKGYAFNSCTSLTEIVIPDSVTTLEYGVFMDCTSLESVKLSKGITKIGEHTFNNCTSLKNLPNLENVKSIGNYAFRCTSLKSVVIPKNVTYLSQSAFGACTSLETAIFLNKETILSDNALPRETTIYAVEYRNGQVTPYYYATLNSNKFVELPEVEGNTVSLSGSINLNYHITLSSSVVNAGEASIKFCYDDGTVISEMNIKDAVATDDSGFRYSISCPVSASKMGKDISVYYVVNGLEICISDNCSIKKYAEYIINNASTNEEYAKACDVAKAMLNYGAYSETALLGVESSDTNSILTDEEKSLEDFPNITAHAYNLEDLSENVNYAGTVISLKNETVLRHYFKLADGVNVDELTFTVEGEKVTPVADGKYYRIDIVGINAKDLAVRYQVKVDGLTLDYGVTSYINSAVNFSDNLSDSVKNAAKALFLYHEAVWNYAS